MSVYKLYSLWFIELFIFDKYQILAEVGNISDSTSDATDGKAEKDSDENGNRIISLNFAPVNTNQQNFINVDSKIDFNTKVSSNRYIANILLAELRFDS